MTNSAIGPNSSSSSVPPGPPTPSRRPANELERGAALAAPCIAVRDHGATVILGCFILFGASTIVNGMRYAASGVGGYDPPPAIVAAPPPPPRAQPTGVPAPYDPYAGASVPLR